MRPFKIYGIWPQASKDVLMYVNTLPQCSPASVGLAQARPNKLRQICSLHDSIPRVHGELSGDVHVATKGESGQNQSGLQGHAETAFHHSARVISDDWASDSNGSGHSTSPFVLSSASTAEE